MEQPFDIDLALNEDPTRVKNAVDAIQSYYNGRPIEMICAENEITRAVFDHWLRYFKVVALEIMEMKTGNERLRKMFVDLSLASQALFDDKESKR